MTDELKKEVLPPGVFNLSFSTRWQVVAHVTEDETSIELFLCNADGTPKDEPQARYVLDTVAAFSNDAQRRSKWLNRLQELFQDGVGWHVGATAAVLLFESASVALMEDGVPPFDRKGIMQDGVKIFETFFRRRHDVKPAGRRASWTAEELAAAIKDVLREMKNSQRTYAVVAKKLRREHGERAPKSGGALRQQIIRLGLDWQGLISGTPYRKKPGGISYNPRP